MDARTATSDRKMVRRPLAGGDLWRRALADDGAAAALLAACDLALLVDADGVILAANAGAGDIMPDDIATWTGQSWSATVAPENRGKIAQMLAAPGDGRWRQVNHPGERGELPVRYLAVPVGASGQVLAVGRDLRASAALQQRLVRAQQAMERDAMRLRQFEARYRLIFETAVNPIFLVDAYSRRILEANGAARRATGLVGSAIEGLAFADIAHADDRDDVTAAIGAAAAAEQRHPGRLRLASGETWLMHAALFRNDRSNSLLVRLRPLQAEAASAAERPLIEALERIPDAFVLTDDQFRIITANGGFLDLVQQPRREDLRGEPLARFLGRPGVDLGVLVGDLKAHGSVRSFATTARALDGHEEEVEVSAVTSGEGKALRHGFSIRAVARRMTPTDSVLPGARSVEQLTELVGRVPLKDIVRESTDLIERLCISAALHHTDDNRASAADLLGLSRQSLYSKLHRHGLGNLGSDPDAP